MTQKVLYRHTQTFATVEHTGNFPRYAENNQYTGLKEQGLAAQSQCRPNSKSSIAIRKRY